MITLEYSKHFLNHFESLFHAKKSVPPVCWFQLRECKYVLTLSFNFFLNELFLGFGHLLGKEERDVTACSSGKIVVAIIQFSVKTKRIH